MGAGGFQIMVATCVSVGWKEGGWVGFMPHRVEVVSSSLLLKRSRTLWSFPPPYSPPAFCL